MMHTSTQKKVTATMHITRVDGTEEDIIVELDESSEKSILDHFNFLKRKG